MPEGLKILFVPVLVRLAKGEYPRCDRRRRRIALNRFFINMNYLGLITCLLLLVSNPLCQALGKEVTEDAKPAKPLAAASPATEVVVKEESPNQLATEEPNIRIQFEGVPYADALQRFSQMTNKPLIIESPVSGTLTFHDPKPYTYQEALDVFNVILSMKGVALVETGRYLQLSKLEDIKKLPLKVLRGTDTSGDVRPGQIVTVVVQLQHLDASEVSAAATSLLSNAGSVAPLTQGVHFQFPIAVDRFSV